MPSRWPRSISTSDLPCALLLALTLLLGACAEEERKSASVVDPRAAVIADESADLERRLDLVDSLVAPCPQEVVEALFRAMKDRSQQAFITVPDDSDLGYHVEESPFGGPDRRGEIRWTAIIALERLGELQALPDLLSALNDRNPVVRNHAAAALWKLGSAHGLPVLVKGLEGKAFENETANALLKEISGEDFGFDTDQGWKLKSEAIERWRTWLASGPRPPRDLPRKGQDADLDRRVRFLVAVLGQHQFLFMEQARRDLALMGDLAVEHIRVAFDDPALGRDNQQLRAYAVQALAMMKKPSALELVIERLENDPAAPVRSRAAEAIGQAEEGGRSALLKALEDADPSVVIAAVRAIGRRGLDGEEARIRALLDAPRSSDRLRLTAAFALVRNDMKGEGAGELLMRVLTAGAVHEKAELAELLQEWRGGLLGWDEREPAESQGEAIAAWRELILP